MLNNDSNKSSSGSSSDSSKVLSVDCSNIDSGISLVNSYISKKVNLSHCKALIISEELAYNGVSDIIYSLINNKEMRPDCNVIISRCNAVDVLEHSSTLFESSPANYYESILNSSEYSGYITDLYLSDFFSSISSTTSHACAILGGINTPDTQKKASDVYLNGDYKANQTPIDSDVGVENMGTAVFVRR